MTDRFLCKISMNILNYLTKIVRPIRPKLSYCTTSST